MPNTVENSPPTEEAIGSLKSGMEDQLEGAKKAFSKTRAEVSEQATELAGDAKEAMVRKAEDTKQGLSGGLRALGGALRAAGDHLSESGQGGSSKLLSEAASGVERFAESLESKPLEEIFEDLRTLGRNNAGGLFAGSMLAGLALGRVLKAADGDVTAPNQPTGGGEGHSKPPSEGAERPQAASNPSTRPPTATSGNVL